MLKTRNANAEDFDRLPDLLASYMAEALDRRWEGSHDALKRDFRNGKVSLAVALAPSAMIGFVAWYSTYDVHHCAEGAEIPAIYVVPAHRGKGVAALLIAHVSREVEQAGGRFLKSQVYEGVRSLYRGIPVIVDGKGECYVGGRAFRVLAGLAGARPRHMLLALPTHAENFEP